MHGGIKGSKLAVFGGAGHGVSDEQPERFVEEVMAFLED